MTIQQIFDLGLEMGIAADPRGKAGVEKFLKRVKKEYKGMPAKKKKYFDEESLTNPYSDSRILYGDPKKPVKRALAGIDTNTGEVLLADRLAEKGQPVDLIIAHHPEGHALAALHEVMDLQVDELASWGVPITIAEHLMQQRMEHVIHRFHPINHGQAIDAAKLLGIPMLALHTTWDNMGHTYVSNELVRHEIDTVGDVFDVLMEIAEYQEAAKAKAGPIIASGSANSRAGKVVVGFTGGTEPPKEIFEHMARAGVGTIVEMHLSEERRKEAKKHHLNVIVTGHMSSDSIGANLFLDELEKKGIAVIPCSGLIRVKR